MLAMEMEGSLVWLQGLRPDTIFGCLYEFLFDPLPEVEKMFHNQLAAMHNSSTLRIAIQVWSLATHHDILHAFFMAYNYN